MKEVNKKTKTNLKHTITSGTGIMNIRWVQSGVRASPRSIATISHTHIIRRERTIYMYIAEWNEWTCVQINKNIANHNWSKWTNNQRALDADVLNWLDNWKRKNEGNWWWWVWEIEWERKRKRKIERKRFKRVLSWLRAASASVHMGMCSVLQSI